MPDIDKQRIAAPEPVTLVRPTVADLIVTLQGFPQDAPVELIDADTCARIRKFYVGHQSSSGYEEIPAHHVYLWNGDYQDMDGKVPGGKR